jgi:hypothetical protein
MRRLAAVFAALTALITLQGCLAATAVGVAAGAAGATIGMAGNVAEGAVKIVTPGGGDDDDDEDGERRD